MRTIRIKVGGFWSDLMSEEEFLLGQRGYGLEIEGMWITDKLTREECRKRYPEQFARFDEQEPLTEEIST